MEWFNKEYESLDAYFKELDKSIIPVPDELTDRIEERINNISVKKRYLPGTLLSAAVLFMLAVSAFIIVPGAGTYAKTIPVLNDIIAFISGDSGTKNARNHDYFSSASLTVTQDDYTLTFNSISIDEERMVFAGFIDGKGMGIKRNIPGTQIRIDAKDLDPGNSSTSGEVHGSQLKFKFEKKLKEGELQKFLQKRLSYVTLDIKVYRYKEAKSYYTEEDIANITDIVWFKDIKIPYKDSEIGKSKVFSIGKTVYMDGNLNTGLTSFTIDQIRISPTIMQLNFTIPDKEAGILKGFINPCLKDDSGNLFKESSGYGGFCRSEDTQYLMFIPSVYYDMPEKLYFCFDGIQLGPYKKIEMRTEIPLTIN